MSKNETYDEFVNKFKPKLTTDDCYTPPKIYSVVLEWVKKYYGVNERIIRPFNPNDDYKKYNYSNTVVVDNPPFSILAEIIDYYLDNNVKFFLFAPSLTCFNYLGKNRKVCILPIDVNITYENGARIPTGFITNLENNAININSELYKLIKNCHEDKSQRKINHSYDYICIGNCNKLAKRGIDLKIKSFKEYVRKKDNYEIFGGGALLHEYDREKFKKILDDLND